MTEKITHFVREMWKIVLSITIVMCVLVISLYLLKNVPAYIQESEENFYSTIEEAEYSLGLRIFLPSYFPDYLIWPPKEIKVVRKPSLIITLVFLSQGHVSSPSLVIHQIVSNMGKSEEAEPVFMESKGTFEETQVSVGKAKATLKVGVGENGQHWNQLSWKAGDRKMVLVSSISVEDLLKIARSIHH